MGIKTASSRMYSLITLYDLYTGFFPNAITGISDEDANKRLDTKANHIAWIAGSLVHERYDMAKHLGIEMKHGAYELFKDHKGIQDNVAYPALSEFKKDWEAISPALRDAYCKVTDTLMDTQIDMEGMKITYYELVSFMTFREAYSIGQIALWRRLLGYEPMKYF